MAGRPGRIGIASAGGSRRVQRGGFASEQAAAEALERVCETCDEVALG
jgi:hypothetical protein